MARVSQPPSLSNDLSSSRRRFSTVSPLSSSPSPSTSARNSHYRPFSTLYTDSPYIEIQDKSSSRLKRHSSIGGLHTFVHMGIGFKDKAKAKKTHADPIEICAPTPIQLLPPHYNSPQRPPTSPAAINPAPALHPVRRRRSLASVADPSTSSASSVSSSSNPHHPLSSPHSVDLFVSSNSSTPTRKKTRFLNQDHDDPSERFVPKSIWAKRHNTKLHPYHQEVPYMQAYDPVLLDR
jgi:hypothetical protein